MVKERLKIFFFLIFIALILCLSGCGIPNYYVPSSSDYSIPSSNGKEVTIMLRRDMVSTKLNKDSFPRLVLFYQIVPNEHNSGFDYVIREFNDDYCSDTGGQRINTKSQPFYSYEYKGSDNNPSGNYGIYQFSRNGDLISSIQEAKINPNTETSWTLNFELAQEDMSLNLYLNDSTEPIKLYRHNGNTFSKNPSSYIGDEVSAIFPSSEVTGYDLKIYALVTTEFNSYSNVFNTNLKQIAQIDNI